MPSRSSVFAHGFFDIKETCIVIWCVLGAKSLRSTILIVVSSHTQWLLYDQAVGLTIEFLNLHEDANNGLDPNPNPNPTS